MPRYDAGVTITVKLEYEVVLEVDANNAVEATDKIHWRALGLSPKELEGLLGLSPSNQYRGYETTVESIGQVGPVGWAPEDGEMPTDAKLQTMHQQDREAAHEMGDYERAKIQHKAHCAAGHHIWSHSGSSAGRCVWCGIRREGRV